MLQCPYFIFQGLGEWDGRGWQLVSMSHCRSLLDLYRHGDDVKEKKARPFNLSCSRQETQNIRQRVCGCGRQCY
ncbi:hypothetical protein RchiOBHm_Chr4g0392101 [Rosa chinensis]|uniref:Uncharacterized protein n=1 Tax=Rosa chinensis TaxID=74649 RepID=A0A2P6QQQ9_ROSCH|nr:hypothetical protein RchiOBHm_Chr4g0392101 [Rosa chinensis]